MEKTITIDGKPIVFAATASTPRRYRKQFNSDMLKDAAVLTQAAKANQITAETLTIFENIAHTMARQADPSTPGDPDEWLDQFEMFSIYDVLPEIMQLWSDSAEHIGAVKKKKAMTEGES